MSELEEVSFWPGSNNGSYVRVEGMSSGPGSTVTCRKRTFWIVVLVVLVLFIISVAIPAGLATKYKNEAAGLKSSSSSSGSKATPSSSTPAPVTKGGGDHPIGPVPPLPSSPATTAPSSPSTTTAATPSSNLTWTDYRLPTNVRPVTYDLIISTSITKDPAAVSDDITFDGVAEIALTINTSDSNAADNRIVLHSAHVAIKSVTLRYLGGKGSSVDSDYYLNENAQQMEIVIPDSLKSETDLIVRIEYSGLLADDLYGFYKSSYSGTSGTEVVLASTQFESVYARRAFPCFDEPSFKAQVKLTIKRPKSWMTLFNTPLENTTDVDGDENQAQDHYEYSPVMSSYLVAFVICDFKKTDTVTANNSKSTNITIYGRTGTLDQLEYAMNVTKAVLEKYEEFFGVPFPLTKLDVIAIPGFAAGAMENWGLITFREADLLYKEGVTSTAQKEFIAYVIAHELAHQWFGNYVTMKWWNELWLNEGFATWVGYNIGVDHVLEDGNGWKLSYLKGKLKALHTDSLWSTKALSLSVDQVHTFGSIESRFDSITYDKGSSIIEMLDKYVGRDNTSAALTAYLQKYNNSNADASDLWDAFDQALNDTEISVSALMTQWVKQPGYPVVKVTGADKTTISVSQERFVLCKSCDKSSDATWSIPLSAGVKQANDSWTTNQFLMKNQTAVWEKALPAANSLYKFNDDWKGFYLSVPNPDLSIQEMDSPEDKANALYDTLLLFQSGNSDITPSILIQRLNECVMSANCYDDLSGEFALQIITYIIHLYDEHFEDYRAVSGYLYDMLQINKINITYDAVEAMDSVKRRILSKRLILALSIDHKRVINDIDDMSDFTTLQSTSILNKSNDTEKVVHPDIKEAVLTCTFLQNEALLWDAIWDIYLHDPVSSEKTVALTVLTRSRDALLIQRLLDLVLKKIDGVRQEDIPNLLYKLSFNAEARVLNWYFIQVYWNELYTKFKSSGFGMAKIIKAARFFNTHQELVQVKTFLEAGVGGARMVGVAATPISEVFELIEVNVYTRKTRAVDLVNVIKKESAS